MSSIRHHINKKALGNKSSVGRDGRERRWGGAVVSSVSLSPWPVTQIPAATTRFRSDLRITLECFVTMNWQLFQRQRVWNLRSVVESNKWPILLQKLCMCLPILIPFKWGRHSISLFLIPSLCFDRPSLTFFKTIVGENYSLTLLQANKKILKLAVPCNYQTWSSGTIKTMAVLKTPISQESPLHVHFLLIFINKSCIQICRYESARSWNLARGNEIAWRHGIVFIVKIA